MNDHDILENLDFLLNLEMVSEVQDLELFENLQEISREDLEQEGQDE